MPYRTLDDRIDGVVITFADITVSKKLETQLREKQTALEKLIGQHNVKSENGKNDAPPKSRKPKRGSGGSPGKKPPAKT
jgi:two-component system CheB/CheR fusion protein